jgi:hypothetical protein
VNQLTTGATTGRYNTIKLKKHNDVINERVAAGTITPGMLIEIIAAGTMQAHSTAEGNAFPEFALEDELQGRDIDDNYTSGEQVQCWTPGAGDEIFAILADGEVVVIGSWLASNGDGYLRLHVAETESWNVSEGGSVTVNPLQIVAQALEALALNTSSGVEESSGGIGYNKRIRVRRM